MVITREQYNNLKKAYSDLNKAHKKQDWFLLNSAASRIEKWQTIKDFDKVEKNILRELGMK